MTDGVIARVERVSHRYGKRVALDDVTIEIPARRMVGVIGPDGVGKSTLLALIGGVRIIQQGHVVVFDGDMAEKAHRTAHSARIAYMPQGLGRNLILRLASLRTSIFMGDCSVKRKPSAEVASMNCSRRRASTRSKAGRPASSPAA
jgi:ribosome-dependent ATPase